LPTLFYILGAGVFAFVSRTGSYDEYGYYAATNPEGVVITILSTMMMIGFFASGMARGALEIYTHYIYLIPESPLKKWLWANSETFLKVAVEAVLIFGVAAIIFGQTPLSFALAAVVYFTLTFYVLGVSLAFLRLTGIAARSVILSVLIFFLYFLPLLPGLAIAITVGLVIGGSGGFSVALLIYAVWQATIGLICFVASKGMLHDCDMLTMDAAMKNLQ
jgi:hypothetical protein